MDAFSLIGVKMEVMEEFAKELGRGPTTADMCVVMKEKCADHQASYVDYLKATDHEDQVSTATHFISHAWSYDFATVVDALKACPLITEQSYIWFDTIRVNQHKAPVYNSDFYSRTFVNAIKTIGTVVLILMPWDDPRPIQRAWCLWEILASIKSGATFTVTMPESESARLEKSLSEGWKATQDSLSNIDARTAEAFMEHDLVMIRNAIEKSIGYNELNLVVKEQMRRWFESALMKLVRSCEDEGPSLRLADLYETAAMIFEQHGNATKSLALYEEALRINKEHFSHDVTRVPTSLLNYGAGLHVAQQEAEAHQILQECIETCNQLLKEGPDENDTRQLNLVLSAAHQSLGASLTLPSSQWEKRATQYKLAMKYWEKAGGEDPDAYLSLESNLARTLIEGVECKQEGFQMLEDVILKRKKLKGPKHSDVLLSELSLGAFLLKEKGFDFEKVRELLETVSIGLTEVLGPGSSPSMDAYCLLGSTYLAHGNAEKALKLYDSMLPSFTDIRYINSCMLVLLDYKQNPERYFVYLDLLATNEPVLRSQVIAMKAMVYLRQNRLALALQCYEAYFAEFKDPSGLIFDCYAQVLCAHGRGKEANDLLGYCNGKHQQGPGMQTISVMKVLFHSGRYDEAIDYVLSSTLIPEPNYWLVRLYGLTDNYTQMRDYIRDAGTTFRWEASLGESFHGSSETSAEKSKVQKLILKIQQELHDPNFHLQDDKKEPSDEEFVKKRNVSVPLSVADEKVQSSETRFSGSSKVLCRPKKLECHIS